MKDFKKIYVLVSGGFDSTLLFEYIGKFFPETTYAVNCFNPYEQSKTLDYFKKLPNFIQVKPKDKKDGTKLNYKKILIKSFKQLPQAFEKYKTHDYYKKLFSCCYFIKHKAFLTDKKFKKEGSVIISGIKWGDGKQRRIFLSQMAKGTFKSLKDKEPTFFLKHKTGQLYCYPFRNFKKYSLPQDIIETLREKYPFIDHSGCALCPVLVVNNIVSEGDRYTNSVNFARRLGLSKTLTLIKAWNLKENNIL